MFPMGTLSFQASQPIGSSKDMSVSIDTTWTKWERYSFKKPESQHQNTTSSESSVNKVMETVMAGENDPSKQDPVCNITDEDGLMELFYQFSGLMLPILDSVEPDSIAIIQASLQGKSTAY